MNVQCGGGSRSFVKEMRALKMKSILAGHLKFENDELRAIFEAEPLTTT